MANIVFVVTLAVLSMILFLSGFFSLFKVGWSELENYEQGQIVKEIGFSLVLSVICIGFFIKKTQIDSVGFVVFGLLFLIVVLIPHKKTGLSKKDLLFRPFQRYLTALFLFLALVLFVFGFFVHMGISI